MLSSELKKWIEGSESWHMSIDYDSDKNTRSLFSFLERSDDFYINLYGRAFDILDSNIWQESTKELVNIGAALELYSRKHTAENFIGVNRSDNILIAASLYYLGNYAASAWFLLSEFRIGQYENEIQQYIYCVLRRETKIKNRYVDHLQRFFEIGEEEILLELLSVIKVEEGNAFKNHPESFRFFSLARLITEKLLENNIWSVLRKSQAFTEDNLSIVVRDVLLSKSLPVWDFFPSQLSAITAGILAEKNKVSLQMPTSSGKTAVCELVILAAYFRGQGEKILFLAPFRALASELRDQFVDRLATTGMNVSVIYGDDPFSRELLEEINNSDLLISTPEKLIALDGVAKNTINQFTTVICDEGHLLDDKQRGVSYEILLTKLKSEPNRKIVFLSAVIPNISDISDWLGNGESIVVKSSYRPTHIDVALLSKDEENRGSFFLDVRGKNQNKYSLSGFLSREDFRTSSGTIHKRSKKALSAATALKSATSGPVALFTTSKREKTGIRGLAEEMLFQIQNLHNLPNPKDFLRENSGRDLVEYMRVVFGHDYLLTRCVESGIGFHHGDLPQYVREIMERAIIAGDIRVILCTKTLAEGVNLPIRTLILHTIKLNDLSHRPRPLMLREIDNIMGRAGRAGKEVKGVVITTNNLDFNIINRITDSSTREKVDGHLIKLIRKVNEYLVEHQAELTDELIQISKEGFKSVLDKIDLSLIELFDDLKIDDEVNSRVDNLCANTFAYSRATEREKEVLKKVFRLRALYLGRLHEAGDFITIKKLGIEPRLYVNLKENIDVTNPVWHQTEEILSEKFIDALFVELKKIPQWVSVFDRYIQEHSYLDEELLKVYVLLWIAGNTPLQITEATELNIDQVLELQAQLINFEMKKYTSSLIGFIEFRLEQENLIISDAVKFFPDALHAGVPTKTHLELINLGFRERLGNLALGKFLQNKSNMSDDIFSITNALTVFRDEIKSEMSTNLPKLSASNISKILDNPRFIF